MATGLGSFQYELKRIAVPGGINSLDLIVENPVSSEKFLFINQVIRRTNDNNNIGQSSLNLRIAYEWSLTNSIKKDFTGAELFTFREYGQSQSFVITNDGSPPDVEQMGERIIWPGERLVWNGNDLGTNRTYYIYYTEIFFGGQSQFS